jgi:hypothetical protein
MIYRVAAYSRNHPTATFWQVFHYFLARGGVHSGHSFVNMSASWVSVGVPLTSKDLARSLCVCHFFERKRIADRKKVTGATCVKLEEIARGLRGIEVKRLEDVLEDRWVELYKMKQLTRKPLHEKFTEIAQ